MIGARDQYRARHPRDPERLRDAHASKVQLLHKPVVPEVLYQAILHEMDSASQARADAMEKPVDLLLSVP